jgi:hypothetical protein
MSGVSSTLHRLPRHPAAQPGRAATRLTRSDAGRTIPSWPRSRSAAKKTPAPGAAHHRIPESNNTATGRDSSAKRSAIVGLPEHSGVTTPSIERRSGQDEIRPSAGKGVTRGRLAPAGAPRCAPRRGSRAFRDRRCPETAGSWAIRAWPTAPVAHGIGQQQGGGGAPRSRREPETSRHLLLRSVERDERQSPGVGSDEEGVCNVPEIRALEVAQRRDSLEFRRQRSIGIDPRQPRQQMEALALDTFPPQRGAQLGLEQVRREQPLEAPQAGGRPRRLGSAKAIATRQDVSTYAKLTPGNPET